VTPSPRRRSRVLGLVLVTALGLAACSSPSSSTAASVGDAEISNAQLARDTQLFTFLLGVSGSKCGTPVAGESQDAACSRLVLSNDIREEIVKSYAAENQLSVEQSAIDDALGQLEQSVGGPEALDQQLKDSGVTRTQLDQLARRLLLFNVVQDDVVAQQLDDAALRTAYQNEIKTFTTVEVAHILVKDQADAERIAAEVTPENFAKIAERESIDTGTAVNGGSLGSFTQAGFESQFIPEFVQAALALQPGQISAPVQSQFGWHVIYLVRKDVAPFETVRDQLVAEQSPTVFDTWFREQADATTIDVNPRFGRYDEKTLAVVPVRSTATGSTGASGASGATSPAGATAPAASGP